MRVLVLGLDGATWDVLRPLLEAGELPRLAQFADGGATGTLRSVFPPLSPVAWTCLMTGKNPGGHGIYEFVEHGHDPEHGRVNSSRAIKSDLIWELIGRRGLKTVAGGVPMSYPHRTAPGFFLGDFLSPAHAPDFTSDPALFAELERELGEPYRPWSTAVHDGGREAAVLTDLTAFLEQHLSAVKFLVKRFDWDLFFFDLMATDRIQHELWHAWEPSHRVAKGRDLSRIRAGFIHFWQRLDAGVGAILDELPPDTNVILLSDHGFGPIEWYVNFNVWLLEQGFIALKDNWYVKQKRWFFQRGATPAWFYGLMARFGFGSNRLARFRGKQITMLDRIANQAFLSREHIDWSRTRAYAQGNFGQIFLNLKGRQPQGCVDPADAPALIAEIKERLRSLRHPETGGPLVETVYERDDLYRGPHASMAPDLTAVPEDWRYRTIGLYDFTTNRVISPSFGPTGDHRLEGVFLAKGPAFRTGAAPEGANLADITPTVLRILDVPLPGDLDGRVLTEVLDEAHVPPVRIAEISRAEENGPPPLGKDGSNGQGTPYAADNEEEIQKRLRDLGYL